MATVPRTPEPTSAHTAAGADQRGAKSAAVDPRFLALQISVLLAMAANGLQGTLLGLRSSEAGFDGVVTGMVMGCYYIGFLGGPLIITKALARYGHIRLLLTVIAVASVTGPLHGAWVNPVFWGVLRAVFGLATAGMYIVWETWVHGRADNANRGRIVGLYLVFMMLGFALGPLGVRLGSASDYALFVLPGVVLLVTFPFLLLAAPTAPEPSPPVPLSLRELFRTVPSAMFGAFLCGVTQGALVGMGAVYARRIGMSEAAAATFVVASYSGTIVTQLPLGWLYDHAPRRGVLVAIASSAACTALAAMVAPRTGAPALALIFILGGLSFPLYGLLNAYMNDWIPPSTRASASAGFVLTCGVGAVFGPVIAGVAMKAIGGNGFFWLQVIGEACLALFIGTRIMRDRLRERSERAQRLHGVHP